MERKVMIAATKSRPECSASDNTPRLPVLTTRNAFSETSSTAEPTLRSAARFFSRASPIGATISIAGLDYLRFCLFLWLERECCRVTKDAVISMPSSVVEAATATAWLHHARRGLPLHRREAMVRQLKPASQLAPIQTR